MSAFSLHYRGEIRSDFLITGYVTASALAIPVVGALLAHKRRLEGEIAQREAVERENAALIEKLTHTLELEREVAAMKVRDEKLRTLRLTMSKVHHHLNNLHCLHQPPHLHHPPPTSAPNLRPQCHATLCYTLLH